jgi:hypothetical protein
MNKAIKECVLILETNIAIGPKITAKMNRAATIIARLSI